MLAQQVNDELLLLLPPIETVEAVKNVEDILDVPGIGGIYIGPGDLGLSHGLPSRMDREEPEMLTIYGRLVEACTQRSLIPAIHNTTAAYVAQMAAMGFRLVTISTDSGYAVRGAQEAVRDVRASLAK